MHHRRKIEAALWRVTPIVTITITPGAHQASAAFASRHRRQVHALPAPSVGTRMDYLAARGAGFHNDVSRHWQEQRAALDLMEAEFDDRSGAINRVRALRDCMKRSTCHVDDPSG